MTDPDLSKIPPAKRPRSWPRRLGQVGDIVAIDPSVVKALQDDAFIPVISPIGFGEQNESYNINADVVASKLATVLKAEKLVLLTNTPGVLDKSGQAPDRPHRARDRRVVCRWHDLGRHVAEDRRRTGRGQERGERRPHHRRPSAACHAAGNPDRSGLRHDDSLALSNPPAPLIHARRRRSRNPTRR
jgi:hypothetical protein